MGAIMRQMTLRDIPEEIEMIARNEANKQGVSLNKAFMTLLRRATQPTVTQTSAVDRSRISRFSRFCGVWSDTEAAEFNTALMNQRSIDQELWQ
jgi:hypothetical protein